MDIDGKQAKQQHSACIIYVRRMCIIQFPGADGRFKKLTCPFAENLHLHEVCPILLDEIVDLLGCEIRCLRNKDSEIFSYKQMQVLISRLDISC